MPQEPVSTDLRITLVVASPADASDAEVFAGPAVLLSGFAHSADLRAAGRCGSR